jgi:NADH dehydrogenase (ubiquinone) 1 alpha subcomplex subunit 8
LGDTGKETIMAAKSSVLYAAAKEIGSMCEAQNRKFLACKTRDENPEACLAEGAQVQDCALAVLKSAMEKCGDSFASYASCLDKQISEEYMFERCRAKESKFRECRHGGDAGSSQSSVVAARAAEGSP